MKRRALCLACLTLLPLRAGATDWAAAAQADLAAAYTIFHDNHPGMVDPLNPGFPAQLALARDTAQALAKQVTDAAGYSAVLARFSAGLRDGHAHVDAVTALPGLPAPRWPGFTAFWRGQGLYVAAAEPGGPALGTQILACDGLAMPALLRRQVFAFAGRPEEPGQWWLHGGDVLRDTGNPFVQPPASCLMAAGGAPHTLTLRWRPESPLAALWRGQAQGDILPPGLTPVKPGLLWMAMPSFAPDAPARAAYQAAFATLAAQRGTVHAARAAVLDLRGNTGGSSDWAVSFADAFWGKGAETRLAYDAQAQVLWRATPDNAAYLEAQAVRAEAAPDAAAWARGIAERIRAAVARHQDFAAEQDAPEAAPPAQGAAEFDASAPPLYVIVPGQCASACLDALDLLRRAPRTKFIGAPSSADSPYMDIRFISLPDGLARIVLPMKLIRGRGRASGAVYRPDIEMADLSWRHEGFVRLIEQDLATSTAGHDSAIRH